MKEPKKFDCTYFPTHFFLLSGRKDVQKQHNFFAWFLGILALPYCLWQYCNVIIISSSKNLESPATHVLTSPSTEITTQLRVVHTPYILCWYIFAAVMITWYFMNERKRKNGKKKKTCSSDSSHKITTIFFLCNSKYNLPLFIPLYFLSIPCNLTNHHEVSSIHFFCCCLCVLRNNDDVRPVLPVWFCGSIGRRNRWVSATRTFEWYYYYCILANTARPTKITRTLWIVIYFFLLRLLPF